MCVCVCVFACVCLYICVYLSLPSSVYFLPYQCISDEGCVEEMPKSRYTFFKVGSQFPSYRVRKQRFAASEKSNRNHDSRDFSYFPERKRELSRDCWSCLKAVNPLVPKNERCRTLVSSHAPLPRPLFSRRQTKRAGNIS